MRVADIRGWILLMLLGMAHQTVLAAGTGWPEAVAQLTSERSKAETCVALLKRYGNKAQSSQGELDYASAKAEIDAVIGGLIIVLAEDGKPESLATLQARTRRGSEGLVQFCGTVSKLLPATAGHRGVIEDIAKSAIEPLIKALSEGIAALYNDHRKDDELMRLTIRTQLEAAKWPDFSQVKAAR